MNGEQVRGRRLYSRRGVLCVFSVFFSFADAGWLCSPLSAPRVKFIVAAGGFRRGAGFVVAACVQIRGTGVAFFSEFCVRVCMGMFLRCCMKRNGPCSAAIDESGLCGGDVKRSGLARV